MLYQLCVILVFSLLNTNIGISAGFDSLKNRSALPTSKFNFMLNKSDSLVLLGIADHQSEILMSIQADSYYKEFHQLCIKNKIKSKVIIFSNQLLNKQKKIYICDEGKESKLVEIDLGFKKKGARFSIANKKHFDSLLDSLIDRIFAYSPKKKFSHVYLHLLGHGKAGHALIEQHPKYRPLVFEEQLNLVKEIARGKIFLEASIKSMFEGFNLSDRPFYLQHEIQIPQFFLKERRFKVNFSEEISEDSNIPFALKFQNKFENENFISSMNGLLRKFRKKDNAVKLVATLESCGSNLADSKYTSKLDKNINTFAAKENEVLSFFNWNADEMINTNNSLEFFDHIAVQRKTNLMPYLKTVLAKERGLGEFR